MSPLPLHTEPTTGIVPLEIGGVRVAVRCGDESFLDLVRDRYEGFRVETAGGDGLAYVLTVTVQDDLLPGS